MLRLIRTERKSQNYYYPEMKENITFTIGIKVWYKVCWEPDQGYACQLFKNISLNPQLIFKFKPRR